MCKIKSIETAGTFLVSLKTLRLQCSGCEFDPRSGNEDPTHHMAKKRNNNDQKRGFTLEI